MKKMEKREGNVLFCAGRRRKRKSGAWPEFFHLANMKVMDSPFSTFSIEPAVSFYLKKKKKGGNFKTPHRPSLHLQPFIGKHYLNTTWSSVKVATS